MAKFFFIIVVSVFFIGCSLKQASKSQSASILIKTPTMKYYDKGFISLFPNYTQVQIYSAGQTVLDLKIYEGRVCQSTFECQNLKSFNRDFLHESYEEQFLKKLFDSKEQVIVYRDKAHGILIKITKD